MEEITEILFRFQKVVLVQARRIEEQDLTDSKMSKMFGWAILNDTIW